MLYNWIIKRKGVIQLINKEHNKFVKSKIESVNFRFEQLFETLTDPEINTYGKREVIKLYEIYSTLENIELFCFTHEDFERFNDEYVEDAHKFYYNVYKMIETDDTNTSWLYGEYEDYKKAYDMTIETLSLIED